ncbi:MAG: glycosyltransferase [Phenylobacterium sp.]
MIIPVHNGETELPKVLEALSHQAWPDLGVTVVLNGCQDRSEAVAATGLRRLEEAGAAVRLVRLAEPSRAAALNVAETGSNHHRLYLDQDAIPCSGALARITDALDAGHHFVGGVAAWRTTSRIVAAAMEAWNEIPYVVQSPTTAGMYAVSAEGRQRWKTWPANLADDKFARLQFEPHERCRLEDVTYSVTAPNSFAGLIAARRRYLRYNVAIGRLPELRQRDLPRYSSLHTLAWRPALWPGLLALMLAQVSARARP